MGQTYNYGLLSGGTGSFGNLQYTDNTTGTTREFMVSGSKGPTLKNLTDVTIQGNLTVQGTTTTVDSTQVTIADRILQLNTADGAGDGGIYVNDAATNQTGSILWDSSTDRWMGGLKDAEVILVDRTSADTMTNKTLTSPVINTGDINTPDIDGGNIDGTVIGATTQASGSFTTLSASQTLDVDGNAQFNGSVTVKNGQTFTSNTVDINGGAIDGAVIGANSAAAGTFTTVSGSTSVAGGTGTFASATVNGAFVANGNIDLGNATSDTITATGRFDSDLVPSTDSARDLGTSALQWAELHVDAGYIDQLGAALDANSQNITGAGNLYGSAVSGSVSVQGGAATFASATIAGTLTANGNVDLGNASSDTITATGQFDSDLVPSSDDARDLGSSAKEWKDLYIDGVAYIDSLQADQLGAHLNANSKNITSAGNLYGSAVSGSVSVQGGAASFVTVHSEGAATVSGSITVAGLAYLKGNVDLGDSAADDTISANGRFDTDLVPSTDSVHDLGSSTLQWAQLHVDAGYIDQLGAALDANSQNITGAGNLYGSAVSGSVSVQGGAGTFSSATISGLFTANGNVDLGNATSDTITATGRFDSDLIPSTDSARDLGSSTLQWAELHVDQGNIDQLGSALDANSQNITGAGNLYGSAVSGSVSVQGGAGTFASATISGLFTANGNVDLGNATSDTITATGRFDSDLVPSSDDARDLGTSALQWKDLYVDGIAYIDQLGTDGDKIAAVYATNVYTGDFHMKNERGDWTLFEEADHLRIRNNKTGQEFKMDMTPISEE